MLKIPPVVSSHWAFNGGLDQTTPTLVLAPGYLRSGSNVEIGVNGGYARVAGYERFSGRAKPSDATYAVLTCTITGPVAIGNVLTDNAGTAFGTVIELPPGQAILTLITGVFATGNIRVAGVVVGTCIGPQATGAAATPALGARYTNLAADVYRNLIGVVPGSGPILGVHLYNNTVYAFRNNAGGTAAVMHRNSGSGWVAVALGEEIAFTNANINVNDGDVLTQGAVTATIARVVVQTGTLASGTNTGRLVITGRAGGNFASGAATATGGGTLTLGGAQAAITFLPGGRFEFDNWNFGGGAGTRRMYGCDGLNRGFEFDGTTLVPIATGMTTDAPRFVKAHKNQLFFAFGSSVQHSGIASPYTWTIITGAAEIGCGDTIAGFVGLVGSDRSSALGIKTRDRTLILYGNNATDWNLIPYSEEVGALPYTVQFITQAVCLDDQGIILMGTTQRFGNFQDAVVSARITPELNAHLTRAIASCIVRRKNQYRVFFIGGAAFYMTFKGEKIQGITKIDFPNPVACITSLEGASGAEELYFGSHNGFVYQMDIGTSFDGAPISWNAELAFNHFGTPRQLKSFRKATVEITGNHYAEFSFTYMIGYGTTEYDSAPVATNTIDLAGAKWDSFTWDAFFWDGRTLSPSESDITGTAENIALNFSGSSAEFLPFTLNGAILSYVPRRALR
ncbi:MAG: hypothetical protein DDT21_02604 [Syntrophomonadaceae bacterium]|nr:hypothetical protein [Bacillota bacterium]